MKKLMLVLSALAFLGLAGCEKESGTSTKVETKSEGPGGETKTTEETKTKVETSGGAAPAAPATGDAATSPAI